MELPHHYHPVPGCAEDSVGIVGADDLGHLVLVADEAPQHSSGPPVTDSHTLILPSRHAELRADSSHAGDRIAVRRAVQLHRPAASRHPQGAVSPVRGRVQADLTLQFPHPTAECTASAAGSSTEHHKAGLRQSLLGRGWARGDAARQIQRDFCFSHIQHKALLPSSGVTSWGMSTLRVTPNGHRLQSHTEGQTRFNGSELPSPVIGFSADEDTNWVQSALGVCLCSHLLDGHSSAHRRSEENSAPTAWKTSYWMKMHACSLPRAWEAPFQQRSAGVGGIPQHIPFLILPRQPL